MTSSAPDESPGRILLVEDDPVTAHFMVHVLGVRGGFDVVHTPDPAAALTHASSGDWDLVLTDVELPGMTGLELVQKLRRAAPGVPVAVVTAHEAADVGMRDLRREADEFLQKPVRPAQLREIAAALVARGRAARGEPPAAPPAAEPSPTAGAPPTAPPAVLAIGAHPGDVEIGAAGTLLGHRGAGSAVSILTLTRGARDAAGQPATGEPEMAALALGATLYLQDLPDSQVGTGDQCADAVGEVLRSVRPAVIYTHSVHDENPDHRSVHRAVLAAARDVGEIYCFQSPSATIGFHPGRTVGIDRQLDRKLLAIGAFPSQPEARDCLEGNLIKLTASYWSRFGGGRHAEAFEVIRGAGPDAGTGPAAPGPR
jgi:LmbE family N-acetylglucosaminyl deacetylase/ActR/RegA family two-component response regulator